MMPAGRGLRHGRRPPAGRHQTGCRRIPTVAKASVGMAEAPASSRRAGDRWSNTGGRARSDDGKSRADRNFQPSNGEARRFQSPVHWKKFRVSHSPLLGNRPKALLKRGRQPKMTTSTTEVYVTGTTGPASRVTPPECSGVRKAVGFSGLAGPHIVRNRAPQRQSFV